MNGKQARNLRKIVSQETGNMPQRLYEEEVHNERLRQVGFNVDGSPKFETFSPVTIHLKRGCQRHAYQHLKGVHHQFFRG